MTKKSWKLDRATQIHSCSHNGRSVEVKCLVRLIYVVTLCEGERTGEIIGHSLRQAIDLAEHFLETGTGLEDARPVGTAKKLHGVLKNQES